jgi:hypothetical protein
MIVRVRRSRILAALGAIVWSAVAAVLLASINGFNGYFLGVVVGIELLVFGRFLTPGRVLLEVDARGIDDRASVYKVGFVPWSAVEATRLITDRRGKAQTLIVQLSDPDLASSRRGAVVRWLVRMPASNVGVNDVYIPDFGDVPLEGIARAIDEHLLLHDA